MNVSELNLNAGERNLAATLFTPEEPNQSGVLLMHGYKSDRRGYAEYADAIVNRLGATCLTIDLPGHGESEGDFDTLTIHDYVRDATAAYDYLANSPTVDPARIGVMGASYGGYMAAMLVQERTPESVLLRAPAIYRDEEFDLARESIDPADVRAFRESLGREVPANMALRAIQEFPGEVTVVESSEDESIPAVVLDTYVNVAKNGTHLVIKGAGHSLVGEHRATFRDMLVDWASKL